MNKFALLKKSTLYTSRILVYPYSFLYSTTAMLTEPIARDISLVRSCQLNWAEFQVLNCIEIQKICNVYIVCLHFWWACAHAHVTWCSSLRRSFACLQHCACAAASLTWPNAHPTFSNQLRKHRANSQELGQWGGREELLSIAVVRYEKKAFHRLKPYFLFSTTAMLTEPHPNGKHWAAVRVIVTQASRLNPSPVSGGLSLVTV